MSEMYQELVRVAQEMERRDAERLLVFCRPENEFEVRNVLAQVPAFVNVKLHVSPHVPENRIIIAKEIDVRKTSAFPVVPDRHSGSRSSDQPSARNSGTV